MINFGTSHGNSSDTFSFRNVLCSASKTGLVVAKYVLANNMIENITIHSLLNLILDVIMF